MSPADINTSLLDGQSPGMNTSMNQSLNVSTLFGSLKKKKKLQVESIYNVKDPKVKTFKLQADSNSMGFATYLKKDFL